MSKPRILILDIETAPAMAYVWGLFDQNIGLNQLIAPVRTIMVGAKWLGKRKIIQWDEQRSDPAAMFEHVHTLLSNADAVVTYNGDRFDLPKLNGAFIEYGLPPLPPITSIDLLKTVRKMGVQSNKLDYVARHLKVGQKVNAGGFGLWAACMKGDKKAWAKMRTYNVGDVRLTERLYKALRPYITNHPRLVKPVKPVGRDGYECPHCGAVNKRYQKRGYHRTLRTWTPRIQCLECGGWGKGKQERIK